jgi:hypothetical protein
MAAVKAKINADTKTASSSSSSPTLASATTTTTATAPINIEHQHEHGHGPTPAVITVENAVGFSVSEAISFFVHYDSILEKQFDDIMALVEPTPESVQHRSEVHARAVSLIERSHEAALPFAFGSFPLRTFLPDGDIDMGAIVPTQHTAAFFHNLRDIIRDEEKHGADVRFGTFIDGAEIKLIKAVICNIPVDISVNTAGALGTVCFFEDVHKATGYNCLFKRSVVVIKAWCMYEAHILASHHSLLSSYAIETMVMFILNQYFDIAKSPLRVFMLFMRVFTTFDWGRYALSATGPVLLTDLREKYANRTELGSPAEVSGRLMNRTLIDGLVERYGKADANPNKHFSVKFLNIVDPLDGMNNLGRSVNFSSFLRIRACFQRGWSILRDLLGSWINIEGGLAESALALYRGDPKNAYVARASGEELISLRVRLNHFFRHTCRKFGGRPRPDVPGMSRLFGTMYDNGGGNTNTNGGSTTSASSTNAMQSASVTNGAQCNPCVVVQRNIEWHSRLHAIHNHAAALSTTISTDSAEQTTEGVASSTAARWSTYGDTIEDMDVWKLFPSVHCTSFFDVRSKTVNIYKTQPLVAQWDTVREAFLARNDASHALFGDSSRPVIDGSLPRPQFHSQQYQSRRHSNNRQHNSHKQKQHQNQNQNQKQKQNRAKKSHSHENTHTQKGGSKKQPGRPASKQQKQKRKRQQKQQSQTATNVNAAPFVPRGLNVPPPFVPNDNFGPPVGGKSTGDPSKPPTWNVSYSDKLRQSGGNGGTWGPGNDLASRIASKPAKTGSTRSGTSDATMNGRPAPSHEQKKNGKNKHSGGGSKVTEKSKSRTSASAAANASAAGSSSSSFPKVPPVPASVSTTSQSTSMSVSAGGEQHGSGEAPLQADAVRGEPHPSHGTSSRSPSVMASHASSQSSSSATTNRGANATAGNDNVSPSSNTGSKNSRGSGSIWVIKREMRQKQRTIWTKPKPNPSRSNGIATNAAPKPNNQRGIGSSNVAAAAAAAAPVAASTTTAAAAKPSAATSTHAQPDEWHVVSSVHKKHGNRKK